MSIQKDTTICKIKKYRARYFDIEQMVKPEFQKRESVNVNHIPHNGLETISRLCGVGVELHPCLYPGMSQEATKGRFYSVN